MSPKEDAISLKQKGNAAFASHDWPKAVDFYSQAIEVDDKDPSFYCNRAQVNLLKRAVGIIDHLSTGPNKARILRLCHRGCHKGY